jgi:hypothetical protein
MEGGNANLFAVKMETGFQNIRDKAFIYTESSPRNKVCISIEPPQKPKIFHTIIA